MRTRLKLLTALPHKPLNDENETQILTRLHPRQSKEGFSLLMAIIQIKFLLPVFF